MKKTILSALFALLIVPSLASAIAGPTPCTSGVGSPLVVDTTQQITNDVDSGNHGNWALDNYARHIQVWLDADTVSYCAQVDYNGTFHAPAGVLSPQSGGSISSDIDGTMVGGYTKVITGVATTSPIVIPTTLDYGGTLANISTWTQALLPKAYNGETSANWLDAVFDSGYSSTFINGGAGWLWTYKTDGSDSQSSWINAGTGSSGDISPIFNSTAGTGYFDLPTAVNSATEGDIIVLGADVTLTSQLNLSKAITLDGNGHTLHATFTKTDNSNNSAIGITHDNVTVKNLVVDGTGSTNLHGINVYLSNGVVLDHVTVSNNGHAGMIVNGSSVEATNLTTTGNSWGAVNVDPGSGVTTPSVFTLNSGTLGESTQIWSDGAHVDVTSTVTVNASGYNKYLMAGTTNYFIWANTLGNVAVITKNDVSTVYITIISAVKAAQEGDIIKIAPGNYNLVKDDVTSISGQTGWYLPITTNNIKLVGITSGGQEISNTSDVATNIYSTQETANGSWSTQNLITVFSDDVTIQGLGIMNKIEPNKGIEVLGNNFTASYNVFAPVPTTLFANANNYGGDDITKYGSGVYFNNNSATTTRTGTVTNNVFTNSGVTFDSFGSNWTVNITNNTFDGNRIWKSGGTDYYYSSVGATTWANQPDFTGSTLNINKNKFINMVSSQPTLKIKSGMTGTFNAVENWWGVNSASEISSRITATGSSTVNYSPWYADSTMTTLSSSVNTGTSSVSTTFTNESTLTNGAFTATIPAGTTITGPLSWDGIFDLPTSTTTSVLPTELNGFWLTGVTAIEIGSGNTPLTFSTPVKLTFAGQSGKHVGWSQSGVFKEITAVCNSATSPTLADGADCKIDVGSDLIVWTRHATAFVSYTTTAIPYGSGGGNGGGNGNGVVVSQLATSNTPNTNGSVLGATVSDVTSDGKAKGKVLGATTYAFTRNMRLGSRGTDVQELQKMLVGLGHLKLATTTQYFGPLTKSAVIKWQSESKLPATGYFGPMSRALLAK